VTASDPASESPADDAAQVASLGPLQDVVRARVISLVAEALGRMPVEHLPPALKRVASFTPARRAKLAGSQIAGVIETDHAFRAHLAKQVRAQMPELAHALESGTPPAAADPAELAALAYLLRPVGWVSVVEGASGVAQAEQANIATRHVGERVERLRRQLDETTAELREAREKQRHQVAALKAENTELRHKLGDARSKARAAEALASKVERAAADATAAAASAVSAGESEARRLRSRVDELERELGTARSADRAEKGSGALRARLLLDALLETAQGLRRELALPAVEGFPADAVEADVAEQGSRTPTGHSSLLTDDPALLDEVLRIPRIHMIVDGYNVTKNAWPDSSLEIQRDRLLSGLAPLVARSRAEVTVVFDAAEKAERPIVNKPRGVRVLFSPVGVIADDIIRQLVAVEPQGRPLVVVSTDQEIVRDVTRMGARAVASAALSRLLARS